MTEVTTVALAVTAVVAIVTTIILIAVMLRSRASSGGPQETSRPLIPLPNTSSVMTSSSTGSWKYDVFLSFRGGDTRKTFVDHLYSALVQQTVCTYKDDETLPRGDTIGPSLLKAIQESQIALIVFSKNYADSSWCLDELAYIMKLKEERGQIVIPIFYDVNPSVVRNQSGKFDKAFSKHKSDKFETWRKVLVDASNIAGWETKYIANGHEAAGIKIIVGTVLDKLLYVNSDVDENLVGMGPRFKYFESKLQIGSHGVRMIGIWGVGGGGKTTLAFSVYMKIRDHFQGHCFIGNIREESTKHGLQKQQEKILSEVLKTQVSVASVQEGRYKIQSMLCRRNVLIVLDDVDELEQLEALAGSHDWFGGESRIIITTRDEHLLATHRVDEVCPVSLLSEDEAIRLFKRHAYQENNPIEDYDELSFRVISYVNGLPLAVKILGSFLYGKDKNEWISALDKLRKIPNRKVTDQLKISYDGLEHDEKQIFLDIACFLRSKSQDDVMEILDACGFHSIIGMKVLSQKALITVNSNGTVDMHDLVQEMGHHIVRGKHPNNPEKHSRVWKMDEIASMFSENATMENYKIEAIQYICSDFSPDFIKLVSNMKKLRFLDVPFLKEGTDDEGPERNYEKGPDFLSNELKYIGWWGYGASPFPESFKATKLVILRLNHSLQKELWKGCKHLPCLKELEVVNASHLARLPDFSGLPCLQKLTLLGCHSLEDIDPSIGNHTSIVYIDIGLCLQLTRFPTIVRMEKLEIFKIQYCNALLEFAKMKANMDSLANFHLNNVGIEVLPSSSVGSYCTNFILPPSSPHLPRLTKLNLNGLGLKDGELPCEIGELSNLQELHLSSNHFSRLDFSLFQLTRLKFLNVSYCRNLVELPELPSNLSILEADNCYSFQAIRDDVHRNCNWLCQVSLCSFVGGERLLETMLQGKAHCMTMKLKGLKIPKGFKPRLVEGRRCRLKLPENWFNEFSGFLFCCVSEKCFLFDSVKLTMRQEEKQQLQMGMRDSQDEQVFWKEESVDFQTWIGYVSFGSLRCTSWWDKTSTAIEVSFKPFPSYLISGSGARLVSKKNQMEETKTTNNNSSIDDDFKCKFKIIHDSRSLVKCEFKALCSL